MLLPWRFIMPSKKPEIKPRLPTLEQTLITHKLGTFFSADQAALKKVVVLDV
jgi:hypothetical protein